MLKSQEMWQKLNKIKDEMVQLQAEGKIDEAHAKIEEINELKRAIEVQEKIEEDEKEGIEDEEPVVSSKNNKVVAFNKAVLGKNLNSVEAGLVERVGESGGYLVPIEQKNEIEELKRSLVSLKDYCYVIPVTSLSGQMPLEVEERDMLVSFDELTEINQSNIRFGQVKWELKDYGDIIPVSNTLLQDETANLTSYIKRRFSKKAVRTENKEILDILKTAPTQAGSDYHAIIDALNVGLDPAVSALSEIITNQTGFAYLDGLEDGNGRPLLTVSLADATKKLLKGREIVVMSDAEFGSDKREFYVGDLESFIAFFDRNAYEMAVSKEAGFTKNATLLRCIERFDAKKVDEKAMLKVSLTANEPPTNYSNKESKETKKDK